MASPNARNRNIGGLWAIVIIAVNVFVIWALATAGPNRGGEDLVASEMADNRTTGPQR